MDGQNKRAAENRRRSAWSHADLAGGQDPRNSRLKWPGAIAATKKLSNSQGFLLIAAQRQAAA
jgi:hypothetical protein